MNKYKKKDNKTPIKSIIGFGDTFRGELNLVGAIRIDGTFIGNIETNNILRIGSSGKGKGIIKAKAIIIGGEFEGELYAKEHVILLSNAYIEGDINCAFLVIEDGAHFSGKCMANRKAIEANNGLDCNSQDLEKEDSNKENQTFYSERNKSNSYLIS